jgi:tetratricopeptide (TPR) repeat protein
MELRAAVDIVASVDMAATQRMAVVAHLPRLEACSDAEDLSKLIPKPSDPEAASTVEHTRERLAQVRALIHSGLYEQASARIDLVVAAAKQTKFAPLVAAAEFEHGTVLLAQGESSKAVATLHNAYYQAVAARDDALAVRCADRLAIVLGEHHGDLLAGHGWLDHARAFLTRGAPDASLVADYENAVGRLLSADGDHQRALAHHVVALTALEQEHPRRALAIAETVAHVGISHLELRDLGPAVTHLERALALWSEQLGETLQAQGQAADARRLIGHAKESVRERGDDTELRAFVAFGYAKLMHLEPHTRARGLRLAVRARAWFEDAGRLVEANEVAAWTHAAQLAQ